VAQLLEKEADCLLKNNLGNLPSDVAMNIEVRNVRMRINVSGISNSLG
jgi:hypothetical protein